MLVFGVIRDSSSSYSFQEIYIKYYDDGTGGSLDFYYDGDEKRHKTVALMDVVGDSANNN